MTSVGSVGSVCLSLRLILLQLLDSFTGRAYPTTNTTLRRINPPAPLAHNALLLLHIGEVQRGDDGEVQRGDGCRADGGRCRADGGHDQVVANEGNGGY